MRRRLAIALLVLTATTGSAAAQELGIANPGNGPVTLYLHVKGFQDFPINTQPPDYTGFTPVERLGIAANTLTCAPDTPLTGLDQDYHSYYGFSTPSYVEYDELQGGRPRIWPERQLGYEAVLDAGVPPILRWYIETEAGTSTLAGVPVPLPNVVVQATLRVGDNISVDDKAYNTGPIVAQGRSGPALLAAELSQGVDHSMVDGRHVYGFTVPMEVAQPTIGVAGYTLRIDVFLDSPACGDPDAGTVMPFAVLPYADAEHSPVITTGVLRPLRIDSLVPRFDGGRVVINASLSSVWGNYDVDEANLTLTVTGPGATVDLLPASIVQRYAAHDRHADPVEVGWAWDAGDVEDGRYRLKLIASNDQRTANATAVAAVDLRPGRDRAYPADGEMTAPPEQELPPPTPALLLVALGVLAAVLRRRNAAA